jgi:NADH dehydrogenase FAD-containing subunit
MAMISITKRTGKYFKGHLARACFGTQVSTGENKQVKKTEVLIVGGGIAGASLACALSQSDYFALKSEDSLKRIVMLDSSKLPSVSAY